MAITNINDAEMKKFWLSTLGDVYVDVEQVTLDPLNLPEWKREDLELAKFNPAGQQRVVLTV